MKNYFVVLLALISFKLNAQNKNYKFTFSYYFVSIPKVLASNQPLNYHNSGLFSKEFPYIKPDEPASIISIMYWRKFKKTRKIQLGFGIADNHSKPNELQSGIYLGNGYTQIGPQVAIKYIATKNLCLVTNANCGFIFTNPRYNNTSTLVYKPYKNLTPFLPSQDYQITGGGASITINADYTIYKNISLSAITSLQSHATRPLRNLSNSTTQKLSGSNITFGLGLQYNFNILKKHKRIAKSDKIK